MTWPRPVGLGVQDGVRDSEGNVDEEDKAFVFSSEKPTKAPGGMDEPRLLSEIPEQRGVSPNVAHHIGHSEHPLKRSNQYLWGGVWESAYLISAWRDSYGRQIWKE